MKRYNEQGVDGVKNQKKEAKEHRRGKAPLLNEKQLLKLTEELKKRPADGGIWTGPKVARWIEKETGVEKIWDQRGWDYLKKCKYSWQKPRPKHKKGNLSEQEEFKKNLPLKVKELQEKNATANLEVWFFDALRSSGEASHRVGLKPILKKVWSKVGTRPTAIVQHRYEWLYVYGFVEPKTGKTHWYLIPRVNTTWLNLVYQAFAADVGACANKMILLVEDRAGWHKSKKVKLPQGIIEEFLPAYSPELQQKRKVMGVSG